MNETGGMELTLSGVLSLVSHKWGLGNGVANENYGVLVGASLKGLRGVVRNWQGDFGGT